MRWGEKPPTGDRELWIWYRDGEWDELVVRVSPDSQGELWAHLPNCHRLPVKIMAGQWGSEALVKPEEPTEAQLRADEAEMGRDVVTPIGHLPHGVVR